MTVSITGNNPIRYTVTEGGSGLYALYVTGTINFTYSPTTDTFTKVVTDTASNSSAPNPYQGFFNSNINYSAGSGTILYTLAIPESSTLEDRNGIDITYNIKLIESTRTQFNVASADAKIEVHIQPYINLAANETFAVSDPVEAGTVYHFPDQGQATLEIESPDTFAGAIDGFQAGDVIDLGGKLVYDAIQVGSNLEVIMEGNSSPWVVPIVMAPINVISVSGNGQGGSKITTSAKGGSITPTINTIGNSTLSVAQKQGVENILKAAVAKYASHFGGTANLNIELNISDFGGNFKNQPGYSPSSPAGFLAEARTPVWISTGQTDPNTNREIYQTASAWKLNNPGMNPWQAAKTMVDPKVSVHSQNGVKPDLVINLNSNSNALKMLDINDHDVASSDQVLLYNIFLHELGHAFGFDTLASKGFPNVESAFESFFNAGEDFHSPLIDAPLTGNHLSVGDGFLAAAPDLMTHGAESNLLFGARKMDLSQTDLAIFQQLDPPVLGQIFIPAGKTFELSSQFQAFAGENVGFLGTAAAPSKLKLDLPLTGSIDGFGFGDTIDFAYLTSTNFGFGANNLKLVWTANNLNTGGTLSLINPANASSSMAALSVKGNYSASQFVVVNDGQSHPLIAWLPTLAVNSSPTAKSHQVISLSSLLTVADPDHVGYQTLQLWDSNGTDAGGRFIVNGVAQTGGHAIDINPNTVANVTFNVGTAGGTDTLWARLLQVDGTQTAWQQFQITSSPNNAPVAIASDVSASHNQNLSASVLFSVTDADNDTITQYQFWDSTVDATSGRWVVGGVAQGANQSIDVSAAQLAGTTFQSGSGSDDLWVRAFDGTAWSAWKEFHVNAPINHAPVAVATDRAVAKNASLAVSSLFSASDSDSDAITAYRFWDSTADATSGHFAIGGVAQGVNHNIDVNAAELAQTTFQTGTTADDLWVQVYDGAAWSAWKEFHLTPPANHTPVVAASDQAVAKNVSLAASALFSVSDSDGDAITAYRFWDSTADATSGHFAIAGVTQGINQNIDVSAAQLTQTTFQTGTTADDLWVQAYDGTAWSAWKEFHLTPPVNRAPVVAAADFSASHNQNIAASSLFSVTDADRDAITQYQLWDSTVDAASGRWMVGGVAQGSNQNIDVSAAQLASTTFQSGSGPDDLWARAFDGTTWSSWKEFHVNAPVNRAPVVTGSDFAATANQTKAVSSLFAVSDADGDAIKSYQFWDSTTATSSGHFAIGGAAQGTNQNIDVSAAQLASTTFVGGTVSDDLWVRASDGNQWSQWHEFHWII